MSDATEPCLELALHAEHRATHRGRDVRLATYRVMLDGQEIGRVRRAMLTRERRTPGRRYVDARWQSPGWLYEESGRARGWECASRRDGIEQLLRDHGLSWSQAETLAATVRTAR